MYFIKSYLFIYKQKQNKKKKQTQKTLPFSLSWLGVLYQWVLEYMPSITTIADTISIEWLGG